jgi:hypothetical protein
VSWPYPVIESSSAQKPHVDSAICAVVYAPGRARRHRQAQALPKHFIETYLTHAGTCEAAPQRCRHVRALLAVVLLCTISNQFGQT